MAFGSGPSLILVKCEDIHANPYVCRARASVQTQICVSLVINIFNRKRYIFDLFFKNYLRDGETQC